MLAAAGVFQVVFPGSFAVGAWLLTIGGAVEYIQQFFCVFTSFVQQRDILRIPDVGRRTGGIHDHGAAVSAVTGFVVAILFHIGFLHNHFVDFCQDFRCQTLSKIYHGGRIKGRFAVIKAGISAEILQIRIFLDLKANFFIGVTILRLDETCA